MSAHTPKAEPLKYVIGGKLKTLGEIMVSALKIKRPTSDAPHEFHKGFRVEGHPPGALEEAEKVRKLDIEVFLRAQREGREFGKKPRDWNENLWRTTHKKRPVRAEPYEVPEAAKVCADMATKAGWTDVVVMEIKRVDSSRSSKVLAATGSAS